MIYQPKNPVGYRSLLTWKQSGDIYCLAKDFTRTYLDRMRDSRLIAHINDSARSVQRNIEEGYKRCSTKEYIQFLGFSRASLEELKGDFEELKREFEVGIRGHKGREGYDKGEEGIKIIRAMLDLIYGQDCMMGRQIASLEQKMVDEKTLPQGEMIKRIWNKAGSSERRFWKTVEDKYGIKRDKEGIVKREEKIRPPNPI